MTNNDNAEVEMFDLEFDRVSKIINQFKLADMKKRRRKKIKKILDSALRAAGNFDILIDSWIKTNIDNALAMELLSCYYELTSKQRDKIELLVLAAILAGEYDGNISEFV